MNVSLPSKGEVIAFGRHVVSYGMGVLTAGVALHVISQGDADSAGKAISQISTGLASIIAGVTTLTSVAMGIWAAWKSSPFAQLLQASKLPNVAQIVVKDQKLADALPDNVVATPLARPGQG